MKYLLIITILALFLAPFRPILAQIEPENPQTTQNTPEDKKGLKIDIETALDPNTFFDKLFNFFRSDPLVQESTEKIADKETFEKANKAIGEKIGVNPIDIIKAFIRTIIWVLESGVAFFGQLID